MNEIHWIPAKGNDKRYQYPNQKPTSSHMPLSTSHKVKGSGDDLTIISSSASDYLIGVWTLERGSLNPSRHN